MPRPFTNSPKLSSRAVGRAHAQGYLYGRPTDPRALDPDIVTVARFSGPGAAPTTELDITGYAGRRNQVLLSRQLSFIDQLPDALSAAAFARPSA